MINATMAERLTEITRAILLYSYPSSGFNGHLLVEVPLQRFVGVVDQELLEVVLVAEVFEPCERRIVHRVKSGHQPNQTKPRQERGKKKGVDAERRLGLELSSSQKTKHLMTAETPSAV